MGMNLHFPITPYEEFLQAYLVKGFDLREAFSDILGRMGPDISTEQLIEQLSSISAFNLFVDNFLQIYANRSRREQAELLAVEARILWYNYIHYAGGEKVFRIHENLARVINETSLRVPAAYLTLPYDGMCLSFEGIVMEIDYGGGPAHPLDSCYITAKIGGPQRERFGPNLRSLLFHTKYPNGNISGHIVTHVGPLPQNDELVDEEILSEIMRNTILHPVSGKENIRTISGGEGTQFEVLLLALKTIAYINCGGADLIDKSSIPEEIQEIISNPATTPTREDRRKLQRIAERSSQHPYIYVGSRLPTPMEQEVSIPGSGVRKISYRFTVRGHFHGFWKKKENLMEDERSWIQQEAVEDGQVWILVLKWVHPYEKGPTEAEKIHRRYYVQ